MDTTTCMDEARSGESNSYDMVLKECEMELNSPSTDNDTMMTSIDEAPSSVPSVETEIAADILPSILSVETKIADNFGGNTPSISNRKKRDQEATTTYPPSPTEVPPPIPIDRSMPPNYSYARSITPTPSVAPSVATTYGFWENVSDRVQRLRFQRAVDDSASLYTNFTTKTGVDTVATTGTVKTIETIETCPARVQTYDSSSPSQPKKKADVEVVWRDVAVCYLDLMFDAVYMAFLYLNRDENVRQKHRFDVVAIVLLVVSVLGLFLSFWAIAASLERKYRGTMQFHGCTVPRLNICLVILHHIPVIVVSRKLSLLFLDSLDAHINLHSYRFPYS